MEEVALARRKQDKELEGAREKIDELTTENQKLSQSKKRVQEEVRGWRDGEGEEGGGMKGGERERVERWRGSGGGMEREEGWREGREEVER